MNHPTPTRLQISLFYILYPIAYFPANWQYHEKYHTQKILQNTRKNCRLNASTQHPLGHFPSFDFQVYALLLLQVTDHRKQVARLGVPLLPEQM